MFNIEFDEKTNEYNDRINLYKYRKYRNAYWEYELQYSNGNVDNTYPEYDSYCGFDDED